MGNTMGWFLRIAALSACGVLIALPCSAVEPSIEPGGDVPQLIDDAAARKLADAVVKDLLAERYPELRMRMERSFQSAVAPDAMSRTLAPMFMAFGKPLEARFSRVTAGYKTYPDRSRKPMKRFWYDIRTTKADIGKYFLWIDIVPDQDRLACAYLSIMTRVSGPGIPQ